MSDRSPFFEYVRAFELAYITDDWSLLEPHFHPDVVREVPGEGILAASDRGRDQVIDGLRKGVYAMDRRFDLRIPEIIEGPVVRPDGLFMRWRLTFARPGLPELEVEGDHLVVYRDGQIARIDEGVTTDMADLTERFLTEHGDALRPEASSFTMPTEADRRRIEEATLRSIVRGYGAAKSQQDIEGALVSCAPRLRNRHDSIRLRYRESRGDGRATRGLLRCVPGLPGGHRRCRGRWKPGGLVG